MTIIDAIGCLSCWPEAKRREMFDVVCYVRDDDGKPVDCWTCAAVALLDISGYLDVADCEGDLEDGLRQVVPLYVESGIVGLDRVGERALGVLRDLLAWGDAYRVN